MIFAECAVLPIGVTIDENSEIGLQE